SLRKIRSDSAASSFANTKSTASRAVKHVTAEYDRTSLEVNVEHNKENTRGEPRVRQSGAHENAPQFWRGLSDLNDTESARKSRGDEFPVGEADIAADALDPRKNQLSRRTVLKYMAASAAMAGLTACTVL